MDHLTEQHVKDALKTITGYTYDRVSGISVTDEKVIFMITVDPAQGAEMEPLRQRAQMAVEKIAGGRTVLAVLTAEKQSPPALKIKSAPQQKQMTHKISSRPVAPQVKHIIAVASGKGGVGKSTVSANLAASFALEGWKTGLLDADIYGSSQPRMMGVRVKPESQNDMIIPPVAHGMKVMSMGFFVDAEAPIVWRGPMVHSAIQQLLRDVDWGDLDVLVIDMPPGTGDAQLSLAQNVALAGAVIVSTPQDVALSEAKKGMAMFEKVNVPVLGLIENMSYHTCSSCGHREDIFGHGGVRAEAAQSNLPLLGEIPLHIDVRMAADRGAPVVIALPEHPVAQSFRTTACAVMAELKEIKPYQRKVS